MKKEEIVINGMSCNHCVMAVNRELRKIEGITETNVEIGKAVVRYDEEKTTRSRIADAIRTAGYQPVE